MTGSADHNSETGDDGDDGGQDLDPIAEAILMVLQSSENWTCAPVDVAKYLAAQRAKPSDAPDLWRKYMMGVRQQAKFLARAGKIDILRKGEAVDPAKPIKGLIKLRLK